MDEHDLAALRERIGDEHLKRRLRAQVDKMIWARGMGRGRFHYENLPLFVHAVKLLLRVTGLGRRGERNALALTVRENPVVLPSLPPALDGLRILLAHSPEVIPKASERGFCLYLTGHTHAGQICLPGGWSPMVNARCPRRYIAGAWTFNGMAGYTSRGTGSSGVFARFNCPPEIVIHVLRASG